MKFFLHINKQVKGKKSKEKFLTESAQIFLYACFSFRLPPRLNINRRITKISTNDRYHEYNTGLKIPHCQSKMAAKNPRWLSQIGEAMCIYIFNFIFFILSQFVGKIDR